MLLCSVFGYLEGPYESLFGWSFLHCLEKCICSIGICSKTLDYLAEYSINSGTEIFQCFSSSSSPCSATAVASPLHLLATHASASASLPTKRQNGAQAASDQPNAKRIKTEEGDSATATRAADTDSSAANDQASHHN